MKWTLRARITLWSVVANGLVLLLGGLLMGWILDQQLTAAVDDALVTKARITASAVEGWLDERKTDPQALLASGETALRLQDLFTSPRDVPAALPSMISLLNVQGDMILSTHTPNSIDQPTPEVLRHIRSTGTIHRAQITMTDASDREHSYRVATAAVRVRGQVEAFVQALAPLQSFRGTLSRVQTVLAFSVPVLLLLNGWLVGMALRKALKPVDSLVTEIHQITERNLSVRVPVPAVNDELHRLAETFNAMLDRLDRGFQFQTRLLQDLSHQLKTPLAILNGTLETALVQGRSAGEYRTVLESSLDEVVKMTQKIENLLLLAQLDSQQITLHPRLLDFVELCHRWCEDFSLLWLPKSLTVRWEGVERLAVRVDPDRIGQALLNLMDNATKFSPEGGAVVFRFSQTPDRAVLELLNQGPPLNPGTEHFIFQRFARDGRTPGYGLGLPIARAAVELHGGRLTAFSPSSGGAGFRLELPLS